MLSSIGSAYLLLVLACPVSMGLMMWFMGRGTKSASRNDEDAPSLATMKSEQVRLAAKVAELERRQNEDQLLTPAGADDRAERNRSSLGAAPVLSQLPLRKD